MDTISFDESYFVELNKAHTFHALEDEMVSFNLEQEAYYGINPVGSHILKMIEAKIQIKELVNQLLQEFEVEKEECMTHTLQFLNDLSRRQIVHISVH